MEKAQSKIKKKLKTLLKNQVCFVVNQHHPPFCILFHHPSVWLTATPIRSSHEFQLLNSNVIIIFQFNNCIRLIQEDLQEQMRLLSQLSGKLDVVLKALPAAVSIESNASKNCQEGQDKPNIGESSISSSQVNIRSHTLQHAPSPGPDSTFGSCWDTGGPSSYCAQETHSAWEENTPNSTRKYYAPFQQQQPPSKFMISGHIGWVSLPEDGTAPCELE